MSNELINIRDQIHALDKKVDLLAYEITPLKAQITSITETLSEMRTANAEKLGVAKFKKSIISVSVTILGLLAALEIHHLILPNIKI